MEKHPDGDSNKVHEYREVFVLDFLERCKQWCDYDEGLMRKL